MVHDVRMERPEPCRITSWQVAEKNALVWMRYWGYKDAQLTVGGADGGVDVRSRSALAQVKFEAAKTGRPALQRLLGAAMRDTSKQLIFISRGGFGEPAIAYANQVDMALFVYDRNGHMEPVNKPAREVARREEQKREEWERQVAEMKAAAEVARQERLARAAAKKREREAQAQVRNQERQERAEAKRLAKEQRTHERQGELRANVRPQPRPTRPRTRPGEWDRMVDEVTDELQATGELAAGVRAAESSRGRQQSDRRPGKLQDIAHKPQPSAGGEQREHKRKIEADIVQGEESGGRSNEPVIATKVLAWFVAVAWVAKAVQAGKDGGSIVVPVIWAAAFVLSAVLPSKTRIWPLVWLIWFGYLTYVSWMTFVDWPEPRLLLSALFGVLTVCVLGLWIRSISAGAKNRELIAAARPPLESEVHPAPSSLSDSDSKDLESGSMDAFDAIELRLNQNRHKPS